MPRARLIERARGAGTLDEAPSRFEGVRPSLPVQTDESHRRNPAPIGPIKTSKGENAMNFQSPHQRLDALIELLKASIETASELSSIAHVTRALDEQRSLLHSLSHHHEDPRLSFLAELSYGSVLRAPVRIRESSLFVYPERQLVHGEFTAYSRGSGPSPLRVEVHYFEGINRGIFQFHFEGSTIARFSIPALLDRVCDPSVSKGVIHAFLIPHSPEGKLN